MHTHYRLQGPDDQLYTLNIAIADGEPFQIELSYNERKVGHVRMVWDLPQSLESFDLFVEQRYRGRGLGKMLLRKMISLTKDMRVSKILGFISEIDLRATPHLPEWYRRQGFQVREATDADRSHFLQHCAVWMLDLTIPYQEGR